MTRLIISFVLASCLSFSALASTQSQNWEKIYADLDPGSINSLENHFRKGGPLKEWISLQLAEAYLTKKKGKKALSILSSFESDENLYSFWRKVLLAETHLDLGNKNQAKLYLNKLEAEPQIELNPEQGFYRELYKRALELKLKVSKNDEKDQIRSKIWALFPDLDENFLAKKADSLKVPRQATPADKVLRLHQLHELRLNKNTSDFISIADIKKAKVPKIQKCRAFYELGRAKYRSKKLTESLNAFSSSLDFGCQDYELNRSLFWKAIIEKKLKRYDSAISTYHQIIKEFPNHQFTDDAYYSLWKIHLSRGQKSKARKYKQSLLKLAQGDMKNQLLWGEAYAAFKKRQYSKAIAYFDSILKTKDLGDDYHPQALYWKARSLEKRKKKSQAKKLYKDLVDQHPLSFYSVIASHRLGLKLKPYPSKIEIEGSQFSQSINEIFEDAKLLASLNLKKKAQDLMDYLTQSKPEFFPKSSFDKLAYQWKTVGDYHQAYKIAVEAIENKNLLNKESRYASLVPFAFPLAYQNETSKAYSRISIPKGLVEGIMREESLFQRKVRSWVGATGLMQLMPATAKEQAGKIAMTDYQQSHLENPERNILLGSTYLDGLVRYFNNNIPLAIMGYNAGPGNVQKWLRAQGHLPLDEFIEEIPFSETRGYVKRVLRSTQVYGLLYADERLQKPFFSMSLK